MLSKFPKPWTFTGQPKQCLGCDQTLKSSQSYYRHINNCQYFKTKFPTYTGNKKEKPSPSIATPTSPSPSPSPIALPTLPEFLAQSEPAASKSTLFLQKNPFSLFNFLFFSQ